METVPFHGIAGDSLMWFAGSNIFLKENENVSIYYKIFNGGAIMKAYKKIAATEVYVARKINSYKGE